MSTVRLIWKCRKPKSQAVVQLCESLMIKAAEAYGMDTAVIRKEPHNTTKIYGRYVQTVPHITGDIVDTKHNSKGYALHWNLASDHITTLPDEPSSGSPNPAMWELKYKSGKGFILVDDDTETVREIE
ncbi:hypothetical protein B0H10DRAFT_2441361 [Mycena sp. CBHHK59/15]|nr:hypothetical protein B0H10DRAFT_1888926 [Mycena sp. CBHHK59/15]KAJ6598719.1 hypothetical protein B0H10DRAFT_2441361 [Mycena sp. CBHHK59/15]